MAESAPIKIVLSDESRILLERIATSLETLASQDNGSTTVSNLYSNDGRSPAPINATQVPVDNYNGASVFADGRVVPDEVKAALDEFEAVWPGASLYEARWGLAWAVMSAYDESVRQAPKQQVFCEARNPAHPELHGPCALPFGHEHESHVDVSGFEWEDEE